MTAASIMDPNPTVPKPTDAIITAARYIMEHRYRSVPVVDEEGCYLGIFGVNRLLRLVLPRAAIMEDGLESVSFIHETLADLHARLRDNVTTVLLIAPVTLLITDALKVSANLIAAGFAERTGQPIRFLPFMLAAFPLMLMSILVSTLFVYLQYL